MATAKIAYNDEDESRLNSETPAADDHRTPFQHDRDRIIHSAAFRRLQGKTQVYGLGASDYYRSRLTHSIEVAQIGRSIAASVGADPDLAEAICLAHDIGHPPFGHAGEEVLHDLLRERGGFNGNAQNLRIVTWLEHKSVAYRGLNLTRATLDGLLKYPFPINPHLKTGIASKKGYYGRDGEIVKLVKPDMERRTFDCEIMNWADDVAYSSHDLEDALVIGTIRYDDLLSESKLEQIAELAIKNYSGEYQDLSKTSPMTPEEVHTSVRDVIACIEESVKSTDRIAVIKQYVSRHINECVHAFRYEEVTGPTPRYSRTKRLPPEIVKRVEAFKAIVFACVIRTSPVYTLQMAGRRMVRDLLHALTDTDDKQLQYLYPMDVRLEARDAIDAFNGGTDKDLLYEVARDFIASMTDLHCESLWRRMFSPGAGLFTSRA